MTHYFGSCRAQRMHSSCVKLQKCEETRLTSHLKARWGGPAQNRLIQSYDLKPTRPLLTMFISCLCWCQPAGLSAAAEFDWGGFPAPTRQSCCHTFKLNHNLWRGGLSPQSDSFLTMQKRLGLLTPTWAVSSAPLFQEKLRADIFTIEVKFVHIAVQNWKLWPRHLPRWSEEHHRSGWHVSQLHDQSPLSSVTILLELRQTIRAAASWWFTGNSVMWMCSLSAARTKARSWS